MWILNTSYNDIYFYSDEKASLEEMALSFFEDDWYDYFSYLLMDNVNNDPPEIMKTQALHLALEANSSLYTIHDAIFLD